MQELEQKKSSVRLTVADDPKSKKAAPVTQKPAPKIDNQKFIDELIAPAMRELDAAQKSVPPVANPAFNSKKPQPERLKPKPSRMERHEGHGFNKFINTMIVLMILGGLGFFGKTAYDSYVQPKAVSEVMRLREKLHDTKNTYNAEKTVIAGALASNTCYLVAGDLKKVQAKCDLGSCTFEEQNELNKTIDLFNDFCGTMGPHSIKK